MDDRALFCQQTLQMDGTMALTLVEVICQARWCLERVPRTSCRWWIALCCHGI